VINESIMISVCVRDCEKYLNNLKRNIDNIRSFVSDTKVLFVESDSADNTLDILKNYDDIEVISKGNMREQFPERTDRLARCRNVYLDVAEESNFDYLLVLDGDSIGEEEITEKSLASNFDYDDWDMMTANQPKGYYDLWALRHEDWMPFDCWEEFSKNRTKENFIRCIISRFRKIDINEPRIKVKSAFGGAGIIKVSSINGSRHVGLNEKNQRICEWVPFCKNLNNVYINPMFVNSNTVSEHIINNMKMLG